MMNDGFERRGANVADAKLRVIAGDPLQLDVLAFSGIEELGRLFDFEVHCPIDDATADRLTECSIVGQAATLLIYPPAGEPRLIRGIIAACEFSGMGHSECYYVLRLVPPAWVLTQRVNSRIFQEKSTESIVRSVLHDHGLEHIGLQFALAEHYEPRDYCVQYGESDWSFLSRLMEEEGMYGYYRDKDGIAHLQITDGPHGHLDVAGGRDVEFHRPAGPELAPNSIFAFRFGREIRPGRVTQTDYKPRKPTEPLLFSAAQAVVDREEGLEVFRYPGEYRDAKLGKRLTQVRLQESRAGGDSAQGQSNRIDFAPGFRFAMNAHPIERFNRGFLITYVRHVCYTPMGSVAGYSMEGRAVAGGTSGPSYSNAFTAIPDSQTFRLRCDTPRPGLTGPQTARVVGPDGEEIHTDAFGRVKVRFHWDRESLLTRDGRRRSDSSCWIRVSQVHAGAGWGYIDIPRVGEEVVVDFLEGDPDQPLIVGRLYNGDNRCPFKLPEDKTRRGNTTHTYKGDGHNELTMDDTKGHEQIRMHAQHDLNAVIRHDETRAIGNDRSTQIANNETLSVGKLRQTQIGVNDILAVGVDKITQVGNNVVEAAGNSVLITAGTSITLQCGAAIIHMNQAGVINIAGTLVNVAGMIMTNVTAPITTVSGLVQLNTGTLEVVAGAFTRVAGGVTTVDGNQVKINSV